MNNSEGVAQDAPAQGKLAVEGPILNELVETAAELTCKAMDKVHGKLTTNLEGMAEIDAQTELRKINADLLAACEKALNLIVPLRMAGRGPVVDALRAAIARAKGGRA